jgi:hypothetical protein
MHPFSPVVPTAVPTLAAETATGMHDCAASTPRPLQMIPSMASRAATAAPDWAPGESRLRLSPTTDFRASDDLLSSGALRSLHGVCALGLQLSDLFADEATWLSAGSGHASPGVNEEPDRTSRLVVVDGRRGGMEGSHDRRKDTFTALSGLHVFRVSGSQAQHAACAVALQVAAAAPAERRTAAVS